MVFLGLDSTQWIDLGWSLLIVLAAVVAGRRLVRFFVQRLLGWVIERTRTNLDNILIEVLTPSLYLLGVILAFEIGLYRLDFLRGTWEPAFDNLFYGLYALAIFVTTARVINGLLRWYANDVAPRTDTQLDEQMMPFFRRIALILLTLVFAIILLDHYQVDVTGLVTTLGVGSLAVALAAKETLSDTLAGFVIMVDRPFRIGDRIEIQDLDTWGDVVDVGLRSSRIRTRDNRMVIIPNSIIGKSLIVNHSYPDSMYRIQIHIGVGYGTDVEHARRTIIGAVEKVEGVLADHPVEALFLEFGDSAMIFRVRWWLDSYEDTRRMFDRVNTAIYARLIEEGIEIPAPQREIHHRFETQVQPLRVMQVS